MATPVRALPVAGIAKMLPVITGVVAIAYLLAAYVLLFMPKLGRLVSGGELDLTVYETRLAETQAYADSLKAVVAAYGSVNPDRRSRVLNIVPVTPDTPGLYVQVDAIARAHGLVLVSIDAVPDEKSTTLAGRKTVRVAINVAGATYQQFKLFLSDLERSERVLDVQAVIFTPASGNYGLVLRAYSLDQQKILQPEAALPADGTAPAAADTDL